jgi:hypothetical protein
LGESKLLQEGSEAAVFDAAVLVQKSGLQERSEGVFLSVAGCIKAVVEVCMEGWCGAGSAHMPCVQRACMLADVRVNAPAVEGCERHMRMSEGARAQLMGSSNACEMEARKSCATAA